MPLHNYQDKEVDYTKVEELNKEQIEELKGSYLVELYNEGRLWEETGLDEISYDAMFNVDKYVSDKDIFKHYRKTNFSHDDFLCSAGM